MTRPRLGVQSTPGTDCTKSEAEKAQGDPINEVDSWNAWPGDLGAPYDDLNLNGMWDPETDRPSFRGMGQMIWGVCNDAVVSRHQSLGATQPIGLELHSLYSVIADAGPLDNTIFMEWKIINRSDAVYDSVRVGLWSDPDLGGPCNDLPGSDSVLSMTYTYNGTDTDCGSGGYGSRLPAAGFVLLSEPARSAIAYTNGSIDSLVDPPDGSPLYAPEAHAYLKGMSGTMQRYVTRPDGSPITFFFSGDPVTGTGDLPENFPLGVFYPQDIREMVSTGPFTPRARRHAYVGRGLRHFVRGKTRLQSVNTLKQDVALVKGMYLYGRPFAGVIQVEINQPNREHRSTGRQRIGALSRVCRRHLVGPGRTACGKRRHDRRSVVPDNDNRSGYHRQL